MSSTSKTRRDHIHFLEDIAQALERINRYTRDLTKDQFAEKEMAIDAVIRNFEIIGEAVGNIPDPVKARYPDVEWKEARAFRNTMIHQCFGIDVETVWDTVTNNLPQFTEHIKKALASETKT